jgi:hypothetical protein
VEVSDLDTRQVRKVNVRKVDIVQSPYLTSYYNHSPVVLTIDTGATTNMIKESFARRIGLPISQASQLAKQADGETPLHVKGEGKFIAYSTEVHMSLHLML